MAEQSVQDVVKEAQSVGDFSLIDVIATHPSSAASNGETITVEQGPYSSNKEISAVGSSDVQDSQIPAVHSGVSDGFNHDQVVRVKDANLRVVLLAAVRILTVVCSMM